MNFKVIYLKENQGHGNARRISLDNCSNELVAIMDSDDISYCDRFEKQFFLFKSQPQVSICGGNITEFINSPNNIVDQRVVFETDKEIKDDIKKRCPMNQQSVMFKKSEYYKAGGYIDLFCEEDYYLWTRMSLQNCIFANIKSPLVNVRIGNEMLSRRGGYKYFKSEREMQKILRKNKIISLVRYWYNVLIRFAAEVCVPVFIRKQILKITRKKYVNSEVKKYKNLGNEKFSVAMCVYGKDNPVWFKEAVNSVTINQNLRPSELVLVVDGPIPKELDTIIKGLKKTLASI